MKEFLNEFRTSGTRYLNKHHLTRFLEWANLTIEQASKLDSKQARSKILAYQNSLIEKDTAPNSIRSYVSALRNFFNFCDIPVRLKNKLVLAENTRKYHVFTNGDLKKLFAVGTAKDKAIISTLAGSGQGIDDLLALERQYTEKLLENDEEFVFFETVRGKTKAKTLFALSPIAIKWIKTYLKQRTDTDKRLFPYCKDGLRKMLLRLKRDSALETEAPLRLHRIRAWFMSSCVKAGLTEWEIKYLVGKKIRASDEAYLFIKESTIKKYKQSWAEDLDFFQEKVLLHELDAEVEKRVKERLKQEMARSDEFERQIAILQEQFKDYAKVKKLAKEMEDALKEFDKLREEARKLKKHGFPVDKK